MNKHIVHLAPRQVAFHTKCIPSELESVWTSVSLTAVLFLFTVIASIAAYCMSTTHSLLHCKQVGLHEIIAATNLKLKPSEFRGMAWNSTENRGSYCWVSVVVLDDTSLDKSSGTTNVKEVSKLTAQQQTVLELLQTETNYVSIINTVLKVCYLLFSVHYIWLFSYCIYLLCVHGTACHQNDSVLRLGVQLNKENRPINRSW